jgi:hypothetical protein
MDLECNAKRDASSEFLCKKRTLCSCRNVSYILKCFEAGN